MYWITFKMPKNQVEMNMKTILYKDFNDNEIEKEIKKQTNINR